MSWLRNRQEYKKAHVAQVFLALPKDRHYRVDLRRRADIRYRLVDQWLATALAAGWIESGFDDGERHWPPPRRWYRITDLGRETLPTIVRNPAWGPPDQPDSESI